MIYRSLISHIYKYCDNGKIKITKIDEIKHTKIGTFYFIENGIFLIDIINFELLVVLFDYLQV